jgi:glycosylphosphatidylinositol transamidase (GPIT) subunit GPI8
MASAQRADYRVDFPSGAMGLELEPLVKSSDRELGCRVIDFFFAPDHKGVDQAYVESKVKIGDIISNVNGEDVRSKPFEEIVAMLKSLKDKNKTIWFKNISASCKKIESSPYTYTSKPLYFL